MSHLIVWPSEPELKTTGIITKFTKKVEFEKDLGVQELSDFLEEWKLHSYKEAHRLYYGKVYRIKNISPNHLLFQVRNRGGGVYHYIDCQYYEEVSKIKFEILVPNSAAYFSICWPLALSSLFAFFSGKFNWEFSITNSLLLLFYTTMMILIGAFFLNLSVNSIKNDLVREIYKLTGLKPVSI